MNTQAGLLLSDAIRRARAGENAGFEDLYLLSYQKTYRDILALGISGEAAWELLAELYAEVWQKRANLPEAGIFRSWLRVLLRDCLKQRGREIPATLEFPADYTVEKGLTEKATTVLIALEERLGLLGETKKRRPGSRFQTNMQWLLTLGTIAATAAAAGNGSRVAGLRTVIHYIVSTKTDMC